MSEITYDTDFAVAALLYALSSFLVPETSISTSDFDWLRQYLGEEGEIAAFAAHLDLFSEYLFSQFPQSDPAPIPPSVNDVRVSPHPPSPSPAGTSRLSSPPSTGSFQDVSAYAPPPVFHNTQAPSIPSGYSIPIPSSFSATLPPVALPIPSAKALGKRKARSGEDASTPEAGPSTKRSRKNVPRKDGEVTCRWNGCGATVPCTQWDKHMQNEHFEGDTPHGSIRTALKCGWEGCKAQGKNKNYPGCFSDLTALFQHVRRNHFKVIDVGCPWPGCNHKPMRRDCMYGPSGHSERCKFNPCNQKPGGGAEGN
ncbi:hypothetical protein C8Q79DRAFT_128395 [Trametes meyenii]|nr:hypothetical protein C8Q79DRAFT_128395 [Trametes meyenii]